MLATMERKAGNEAEGWIHVIDQKRCTAMAVAEFGRAGLATIDRFDIHGTGQIGVERRFPPEKTGQEVAKVPIKTLRFWLHFVTNPVQVSAAHQSASNACSARGELGSARRAGEWQASMSGCQRGAPALVLSTKPNGFVDALVPQGFDG